MDTGTVNDHVNGASFVRVSASNSFPSEIFDAQRLFWNNDLGSAGSAIQGAILSATSNSRKLWLHSALTEVLSVLLHL